MYGVLLNIYYIYMHVQYLNIVYDSNLFEGWSCLILKRWFLAWFKSRASLFGSQMISVSQATLKGRNLSNGWLTFWEISRSQTSECLTPKWSGFFSWFQMTCDFFYILVCHFWLSRSRFLVIFSSLKWVEVATKRGHPFAEGRPNRLNASSFLVKNWTFLRGLRTST